ncbi:uncharacterized protein LOC120427786 [Culex pipiens pallens]|uniref:uncharacterized protein LOC120427786 n=1 Tax=Culex pipiens pallens TaxID=42434 RepID=UPI001952FD06|nr:uncharacterized protein LOC120427786 [Culex pipiens pallens]
MEPCEGSVNIIKQGWIKTITIRNSIRQMDDPEAKISEMFKRFPILGAFDGNLINLDFNHLFPGSADAANRWNDIQHKILQCFKHHASIENEFIRAVVFVKENNPTRGVKRTHDGSKEIRTTLDRIVEWISPEDNVDDYANKVKSSKQIFLLVKASPYKNGESYVVVGKRCFYVGSEIEAAFFTFLKVFKFLNVPVEPSLKNFFALFDGAIFQTGALTTTGTTFMVKLG